MLSGNSCLVYEHEKWSNILAKKPIYVAHVKFPNISIYDNVHTSPQRCELPELWKWDVHWNTPTNVFQLFGSSLDVGSSTLQPTWD